MKLVIDTNRLIAALLKSSVSREIILSEHIDFYSPDFIVTEIEKHRKYLIKKAKIKVKEFDITLFMLLEKINLVPFEEFKEEYMDAVEIMRELDINDTPFIALSLAIKADGIWTEDKAIFKQNVIQVYSTKDLLNTLKL